MEPGMRVEREIPDDGGSSSKRFQYAQERPLTEEDAVELFRRAWRDGVRDKVRVCVVAFEIDREAPPKTSMQLAGHPKTRLASVFIGLTDLLGFTLEQHGLLHLPHAKSLCEAVGRNALNFLAHEKGGHHGP